MTNRSTNGHVLLIRRSNLRDWLSMKHSIIDVLFQVEQYPRIQLLCTPRSISERPARGHSQTEHKGTALDCEAFSLSVSPSSSQPVCAASCCSFLKHCRLSLSDTQKTAE